MPREIVDDGRDEALESSYLFFEAGGELFATPLLELSEVVEPVPLRTIPRTSDCFLGLGNLRSEVISVIDLRSRFGMERVEGPWNVLLMFPTPGGNMGAMVDRVVAIEDVAPADIDPRPSVFSSVPAEFLAGVIKRGDSLVPAVALAKVLSQEEWTRLADAKGTG